MKAFLFQNLNLTHDNRNSGDLDLLKTMFKPMLNTHRMNHIEYRVFNSIQDPAAKKIEERYSFLQGKVADAVIF